MYIKKTYTYSKFDFSNFRSKGRLDYYDPPTQESVNYKNFIATLDLKTCLECRENYGKIYYIDETPDIAPPLHPNCRCEIKQVESVIAGNATKDGTNGADWWIKNYGVLPDYYISEEELKKLGWTWGKSPVKFAPGKMYCGGVYNNNKEGHLPHKIGRIWYEADINYYDGKRNRHRILWSNDGLIFVTYDHYHTFYEIV